MSLGVLACGCVQMAGSKGEYRLDLNRRVLCGVQKHESPGKNETIKGERARQKAEKIPLLGRKNTHDSACSQGPCNGPVHYASYLLKVGKL